MFRNKRHPRRKTAARHAKFRSFSRRLQHEWLEDRRMLTVFLAGDLEPGDNIGLIKASGFGTRQEPYVYDFAGQDLDMGTFDIRGAGLSFRFENLGEGPEGNSVQYSGDGGDINVSHDSSDGGSVEIIGSAGAIELASIITAGNSGGKITIDDGAMGPSGAIRIAGDIDTYSTAEFIPESSGRASVTLHGHSVEVLGNIRTASNGLDAGHVTILGGPAGINIVGGSIDTEGARAAGNIEIRGPGSIQLDELAGVSVNTRGWGGDVVFQVETVSLAGRIDTSGAGPLGSGSVQIDATTVSLRGNILTDGLTDGDVGGSITILASEQVDIQADHISTSGTGGGRVEIKGPGTLQLDGTGGLSIDTSGSGLGGGSVEIAVDTILLGNGINTSTDGGGNSAGVIDIHGQFVEIHGDLLTSNDGSFSGAIVIEATEYLDIMGGTIISSSSDAFGASVRIAGPGNVQLDGIDENGWSVNTTGPGVAGSVIIDVNGIVRIAGGIDARDTTGDADRSGRVELSGHTIDVGHSILTHSSVTLDADEDVYLGTLDVDSIGSIDFLTGRSAFIHGELKKFDTTGEPQQKLDSPGVVFYDPMVPANNYLNRLKYALESGGVLRPLNVAPTVSLQALADTFENDEVVLSGSYVDADVGDSHQFAVDWDDDNAANASFSLPPIISLTAGDKFDSSTGEAVLTVESVDKVSGKVGFSLTHQYLDDGVAPGNATPADPTTIEVTVTDDLASGTGDVSFQVQNLAPEITRISTDANFDDRAEEGEPVTVSATFGDVGTLDEHSATIYWGDGSTSPGVIVESNGSGTITASHSYAAGGIFSVTVTLNDDDLGTDVAETTVVVTGVGLNEGVLHIIGTSAPDEVYVNTFNKDQLKVHATFLPEDFRIFDVTKVDKIIAYLFEGDDVLTISRRVPTRAIIHGGDDNDQVSAGGGPTVLLGDSGSDTLNGNVGRSILIGGHGADRLVGGNQGDILIGGSTDQDDDDDAITATLAAWSNNDDYENRVAAIDSLLAVDDDHDEDTLTGSSGRDLFYEGLGDVLTDVNLKNELEAVL